MHTVRLDFSMKGCHAIALTIPTGTHENGRKGQVEESCSNELRTLGVLRLCTNKAGTLCGNDSTRTYAAFLNLSNSCRGRGKLFHFRLPRLAPSTIQPNQIIFQACRRRQRSFTHQLAY